MFIGRLYNLLLPLVAVVQVAYAFAPVALGRRLFQTGRRAADAAASSTSETTTTGMAQYLLDLHHAKATFDFCGGMMFQLELTPAL